MRVYDWDPIRAAHYGQRPHRSHKQAGHMTAPDQCCRSVRKFLPGRRPHMTQSGHESLRVSPLKQWIADDSLIEVELANVRLAEVQHVAQNFLIVFPQVIRLEVRSWGPARKFSGQSGDIKFTDFKIGNTAHRTAFP